MADEQQPLRRKDESASIGEVVEFVKTYARQETVGPLKGAGKWIAVGSAAALCLGIGLMLLMLGLLRLIQSEWEDVTDGRLSWIPYLIVLVVTAGLLVLTISRISKTYLNKEAK